MTTFQAKEKEVRGNTPANLPQQTAEELPSVDITAFGLNADAGSALHRSFVYATRAHTLADILRVGYFGNARRENDVRDFGVKEWDVFSCTVGPDPATAIEVDLRVVSIGQGRGDPIVLAQGPLREFRARADQ